MKSCMTRIEAAELLLKFLQSREDQYLVLRNADIVDALGKGSDLDLLVRDVNCAVQDLETLLGKPFYVLRRSYLRTMVFPWGHVDVADRIVWRWIPYLNVEHVFSERRSVGGVSMPSVVHEAVISWFSSLLWGGFTKERYRASISETARSESTLFADTLSYRLPRALAAELAEIAAQGNWTAAAEQVPSIRRSLERKNGYWANVWGRLQYFFAEIRLRLLPSAPVIALLGPDGAGKTTIRTELERRLSGPFSGVASFHWRPKVLLAVGVLLRRRREEDNQVVENPQGNTPHSPMVSLARLLYYLIDYWIGWFTVVSNQRAKNRIVVFDRYSYDMAIDPRRFRFALPSWLLNFLVRLTPRLDLAIFLTAPTEVFLARKNEVSPAECDRQRLAYREYATNVSRGVVVNVDRSVSCICDEILALLWKDPQSEGHERCG